MFSFFVPSSAPASGSRARLPVMGSSLLLVGLVLCAGQPLVQADPTKPVALSKEAATAAALDQKLINEAKTNSEVMANLTYLSDVIGPRLTGSANLKRANEWAAEKMKSYGLENVRLEPWELPMAWQRGGASARIVEPDNGRALTVAAMGWTPGTKGKITGDVVVVNARTPEDLKKYEGKLKNAIVLRGPPATVRPISDLTFTIGGPGSPVPAPSPATERPGSPDKPATPPAKEPEKTQPQSPAAEKKPETQPPAGTNPATPPGERPRGFDSRPFSEMMRFRREMNDFFRKEGVAVLLTDSGKPHGLLNMTGSWSGRDRATASEALPTLFVTHDHYALLHRLASRPNGARTRVEVEVENKLTPGPLPVYNTVGEIPGTEKPNEYVVLGAHIDSWDLGQGTTDNGTGTCVVLEAARLMMKSGIKPKRTIRFVLFSGEEQGLHGSKAYVAKHKEELPRTSAALIHDTGTGKVVGISLQGRDAIKPIMEAELTALKALGVAEISTRSMGGSDHMSFDAEGVPGFMFRQDPAEYRLTHHSQSDTLDKAREADLVQGAQVMAVMAVRIANRDELLPRDKKPAPTTTPPAESPTKPAGSTEPKKP